MQCLSLSRSVVRVLYTF